MNAPVAFKRDESGRAPEHVVPFGIGDGVDVQHADREPGADQRRQQHDERAAA